MNPFDDFLRLPKVRPRTSTPSGVVDIGWDEASGSLVLQDADGQTPIGGGGGEVTNTTVNVAISENPAATREALVPDGEAFEVDGLELSDQSEVIQPEAGWLIKNGPGLAFSDGENPGGDLISDPRVTRTNTYIPAATYASNARVVLGEAFVPARYASVGATLKFLGSLRISNIAGNVPAGTVFGVVTSERKLLAGNTFGSIFGAAVPNGENVIGVNLLFTSNLIASGDNVALGDGVSTNQALMIHGSSGNVTVAASTMLFEELSFGDEMSTTPPDEGFYIYYVLDIPASATPSASISVALDFTVFGE